MNELGRKDKGFLIAVEGVDGAGKSSVCNAIRRFLAKHDINCDILIRSSVLNNLAGLLASPKRIALEFLAERADSFRSPFCKSGEVLVCDRFTASTIAYLGSISYQEMQEALKVCDWAVDNERPDLTILLDIDPEISLKRKASKDFIEKKPLEFHKAVRANFLRLAGEMPTEIVDASLTMDEVQSEVLRIVADHLLKITKISQGSLLDKDFDYLVNSRGKLLEILAGYRRLAGFRDIRLEIKVGELVGQLDSIIWQVLSKEERNDG